MNRSIEWTAGLLTLAVASAAAAQVSHSTQGQVEARTALDLMPAKAPTDGHRAILKKGADSPFENTQ